MTDDKMQCPFCNVLVKNIKLHFSRAAKCGNRINFHAFTKIYEDYQKKKNQERKRKNYLEQKKRDGEKLKKRNSEAVQKYTDKLKAENKELFDLNRLKIVIKCQEKAKEENKEQFDQNQLTSSVALCLLSNSLTLFSASSNGRFVPKSLEVFPWNFARQKGHILFPTLIISSRHCPHML